MPYMIFNPIVKSLRKVFVIVAIAVFGLTFIGCDEDDSEKYDYSNIPVEEIEPVELNFYSIDYGSGLNDEVENIMQEIEIKLKDTIKVRPRFHIINNERYDEEIKKLISAGEKVDAFTCYNPLIYKGQDIMKDISDIFPKYASDYYNELMSTKIGEDYLHGSSIDGKLYCVPYNNFNSPRYCIIARKDLVNKYAKNGFETLEDYSNFLKDIKENEKDLIPGVVFARLFFDAYMKGNGYFENSEKHLYSSWNKEGKDIYSIENTETFNKAYTLLKNWRINEYVPKKPEAYNHPDYISNGILASRLVSIREARDFKINKVSNAYEYCLYPLYMNSTHMLEDSPIGVAVASSSKNAERVLMFIEWMHESLENYTLFRYGVEDRNYSIDNEKLILNDTIEAVPDLWNITTNFFSDYRYERSYSFDPDYQKIFKEASLNNVRTRREMFNLFDGLQKDKNKRVKFLTEYKSFTPILEKYSDNMEIFFEDIEKGHFRITPEELSEIQKKAGIDTLLKFYRDNME